MTAKKKAKTKAKKRNQQDATLRNIRALKKRVGILEQHGRFVLQALETNAIAIITLRQEVFYKDSKAKPVANCPG